MSFSVSGHRRGFTLVELLVVIGIIALLVAMLMPAMQAAKRAMNTIACASNLRQIAYAYSLYAHDNQDLFPWAQLNYTPMNGGDQIVITWDDLIAKYLGRPLTEAEIKLPYAPRAMPIMVCPEDNVVRTGYVVPITNYTVHVRSYAVPCAPGTPDDLDKSTFEGIGGQLAAFEGFNWKRYTHHLCIKRSWLRKPSQMILAFDMFSPRNNLGGFYAYAPRPYDQTVAYGGFAMLGKIGAHGLKYNYAFADGHVETLMPIETVRWNGALYASYIGINHLWTRNPND